MDIASLVGWSALTLLLFFILRDTVRNCYYFIFIRKYGLTKDLRSFGSWAVVTGATDGIGKAYAVQLAKRGLSVYLLGRNESKLRAVTAEIVNNVGMCYTYPKYYHEVEDCQFIESMIRVNCEAITQITKIILPQMIRKRTGAIINISSALCKFPGPYLSLYGATKAFISSFTSSLQEEYHSSGVTIQGVLPFYVVSNMCRSRPSFFVPHASDYANSALDTLGLQDWTFGCFSHATLGSLISYVRKEVFVRFFTPYMAKVRRKQVMKWTNNNNWVCREKPKYG
ncbi:unnamed protein product [Soboliphyme baturini]|uniref:Hydroxysteroid 17-beta dehydrogenase 12 n=1 Tax=Soboliphyme baturini TaxID=241478 RepID=A0A183IGV5_9BILA|nr:unnamed protein product [Soboliphyme baturini]